jgi:uncharacterized protein (TIGR02145 family)
LFYRWDFDGDGQWDTGFSKSIITMHQFSTPGTYKTLCQVQDPIGAQDTCSRTILVSNGTNITGICTDTRGMNQSFGTVLIGSQWWFSRNMTSKDTAKWYEYPVTNNWPAYFEYGHLYTVGETGWTCPPGWRVPSKDDWDKLFSNYPADRLYEALMPGGESDFGATLGGMGTGFTPTEAIYGGLDRFGYYWSTTKPHGVTSPSVWIISFEQPDRKVLKGYLTETKKLYAIRCMKDL